jgi:hypothetical protein
MGIFDCIVGGVGDGKVYLLLDMTEPDGMIRYVESTDHGISWSTPYIINDSLHSRGGIWPSIVRYDNWLFASWLNFDDEGPLYYNIGFRRSSDLGASWDTTMKVLRPDRLDGVGYRDLGVVGNRPYVVLYDYVNDTIPVGQFCLATANGQQWGTPREIFRAAPPYIPIMHTATTGNVIHIIWEGALQDRQDMGIFYLRSTDSGNSWSSSFNIRPPHRYFGIMPKIATNERGDIIVCWMDYRNSPPLSFTGDIFYRISVDSGQTWQEEVQLTSLAKSTDPDIGWDGSSICAAYMDYRDTTLINTQEIYFRRSSDNGLSWLPEERLTNDSLRSEIPMVLVDNDTAYVFWSSKDPVAWDTSEYSGVFFKRYDPEPDNVNKDEPQLPSQMGLEVYPNPFNSQTIISLSLQGGGEIDIGIYDVTGKLVRKILKGGELKKGTYKYAWDATDAFGKTVCSGIYFVRASTPQGKLSKTLTLIK